MLLHDHFTFSDNDMFIGKGVIVSIIRAYLTIYACAINK
jgi:hypothetical protein